MLQRHGLDEAALDRRIRLNDGRLREPYYRTPQVFQEPDAEWPADREGRALLAFDCHEAMAGAPDARADALFAVLPERTDGQYLFGRAEDGAVSEQRLSGHSWLLRGLCERYELRGDPFSLRAVRAVTEGLYLPLRGRFRSYPVERGGDAPEGGVAGHGARRIGGWLLSTDVGCAFMCLDGLSHAYRVTRDPRVAELTDEMTEVLRGIDKVALRAQTHCTLSAARGMLRMYGELGQARYLEGAREIYDLYTEGGGMDAAYRNLNWWGRPDTWTEPCAIVDSLILSGNLYRATGEEPFRRMAARIYLNGLATAQRGNGGAGTDSVVYRREDFPGFPGEDALYMKSYEAPFCCTMRLAEGLRYARERRGDLWYETETDASGALTAARDAAGRYLSGDLLLAEPSLDPAVARATGYALPPPAVTADGRRLSPLIPAFPLPDAVSSALRQRILF